MAWDSSDCAAVACTAPPHTHTMQSGAHFNPQRTCDEGLLQVSVAGDGEGHIHLAAHRLLHRAEVEAVAAADGVVQQASLDGVALSST